MESITFVPGIPGCTPTKLHDTDGCGGDDDDDNDDDDSLEATRDANGHSARSIDRCGGVSSGGGGGGGGSG
jgi:hypothetical protein